MNKAKHIAYCGVLCALAFGLSYIEMILPISFAIPGIKLGLANLVILVVLYRLEAKDAIAINIIRVILMGAMFSNAMTIWFGLSGAAASFVLMYLLKKGGRLHIITVSILGAIAHMVAQMLVGLLVYPPKVIVYYCVFLLVAAIISGALIGILSTMLLRVIRKGDMF